MDESKVKINEDLAFNEVERWADAMKVDLYVKDAEGNKVLDSAVSSLVKAVQEGSLIVNDKSEFEYTVSEASPEKIAGTVLVFKRPNGAAFLSLDKFKATEGNHKIVSMASSCTGQDISWFSKLDGYDYKIVQYIASFFIAG